MIKREAIFQETRESEEKGTSLIILVDKRHMVHEASLSIFMAKNETTRHPIFSSRKVRVRDVNTILYGSLQASKRCSHVPETQITNIHTAA